MTSVAGASGPAHSSERGTGLDPDLALLLLLGVLWGAAFPAIRWGILNGASPILFAAVRYGIAAGVLLAIAWVRGEPRPDRRSAVLVGLLGAFALVGSYAALLYWGEETTSAGLAAVLISSSPLWSGLLTQVALPSERLSRAGFVWLALGFVGILVIFGPTLLAPGGSSWLRPLAVLLAAALFASGSVALRHFSRAPQGAWGVGIQFSTATVLLFAVTAATEPHPTLPLDAPVLLALGYLVALPSVVGYLIYFRLHHRVGPLRANVVSYVSPVTGIVLGVLLLGESVTWNELGGFGVLLVALLLYQRDRRSRSSDRSGPPAGDRPVSRA